MMAQPTTIPAEHMEVVEKSSGVTGVLCKVVIRFFFCYALSCEGSGWAPSSVSDAVAAALLLLLGASTTWAQ